MSSVFFITHPEVVVDPGLPVAEWRLSEIGHARMARFATAPEIARVRRVWCSDERKAVEAAAILADSLGLPEPAVLASLRENDRSATGYLPEAEFEATADLFFADPDASACGWETARAAQARIVTAIGTVSAQSPEGDELAIVSHGAVGALLLCRLAARPIGRDADQPSQGHYFAFDRASLRLLHGWRSIG